MLPALSAQESRLGATFASGFDLGVTEIFAMQVRTGRNCTVIRATNVKTLLNHPKWFAVDNAAMSTRYRFMATVPHLNRKLPARLRWFDNVLELAVQLDGKWICADAYVSSRI